MKLLILQKAGDRQLFHLLKLAPEIDLAPDTETIDKDPKAVAVKWAVKEGERLAKEGEVEEAIAVYQQAQKLAPEIDLAPETEAIDKESKTIALELAAPAKVEQGEKLARRGKVQKAIAAYKEVQKLAPEIDLAPETEAIDKEPKTIALELAAPAKVEQGEKLARRGKVIEAIAVYQQAQKLDPEMDLAPETEAIDKEPKAVAVKWAVKEGERLAKEREVEEAIAAYKEAQQLDPDIDLNPDTEAVDKEPKTIALELAAPAKVEEGKRLAKQGKVEEAIAAYKEAQKLNPEIDLDIRLRPERNSF